MTFKLNTHHIYIYIFFGVGFIVIEGSALCLTLQGVYSIPQAPLPFYQCSQVASSILRGAPLVLAPCQDLTRGHLAVLGTPYAGLRLVVE